MSIMFDWSRQSRAPFAGERRFSKSRGLSASVFFLPLPHPLFLILLSPQFCAGKIPFLGLSLLLNPTETLTMQGIPTVYRVDSDILAKNKSSAKKKNTLVRSRYTHDECMTVLSSFLGKCITFAFLEMAV